MWRRELQRLIDDGLVQLTAETDPRVVALPHPRAAQWTEEVAAAEPAQARSLSAV